MALRRRQRAERVMPLERMRERALASRVSDGRTGVLELTLRHNHVGSKGMAYLAAAMRKNAQLQLLALQANPIGDTGAALLGRVLTTHRGLTELGLQHCGISSRGVKHLAAGLAHNRTLRRLWLLGNKAKDDGAAHLAGTLRRCGVVALGLERNGVGRKGADALATALASPGLPLQWLRLQHNDVGEHGGAALARALRNNRALTKPQLRECGSARRGASRSPNRSVTTARCDTWGSRRTASPPPLDAAAARVDACGGHPRLARPRPRARRVVPRV